MEQPTYINRLDTGVSHIYASENADFYHPLCGVVSIWKQYHAHRATHTETPTYRVCGACARIARSREATAGKFRVFYARSPAALLGRTPYPAIADLPTTHILVRSLQAEDRAHVYWLMQGEQWSPHGEARPLIEKLGLSHTSLSLGDVVQTPDGRYHVCAWLGWADLPEGADVAPHSNHEDGVKVGCPVRNATTNR